MRHLVSPLPPPGEVPMDLRACYVRVKEAHDYLARQGWLALAQAAVLPDDESWGSALKRLQVTLDGPRPSLIQTDSANHNLVEVINQCATMERLLYALRWAQGQDALRDLRVLRCHPTTSSTQDVDDNDLVLVDAHSMICARFEVSDVVGERDGNDKERSDLRSLGVLPDPDERRDRAGNSRLFLIVSDRFAKHLGSRTKDDAWALRRGYYYIFRDRETIADLARGGTCVVEVIRRPRSFLEAEKARYVPLKPTLISPAASEPGIYKSTGRKYPFCLPAEHAAENLLAAVRDDAMAYFAARHISWHDSAAPGLPSNHLCSSQVACVNALWPLARDRELAARAFRPFLPHLDEVIALSEDGAHSDKQPVYLGFEWIGQSNYLGEAGWGTRGANATSADFVFRFRRTDGRIELVLGEWKYTESYTVKLPAPEAINKTRYKTYQDAFTRWRDNQPDLPPYEAFFVEPFYQLMRLTLLAREMEHTRGQGNALRPADIVSVVYISPAQNDAFAQSLTSPQLAAYGTTVHEIWQRIAPPSRFVPIASEHLLDALAAAAPGHLHGWRDALLLRYGWWR